MRISKYRIDLEGARIDNAAIPDANLTLAINEQTDSYTLVLTDSSRLVDMNKATANILTVPPNSSVAFAIGTQILIRQKGAGQTSVVAGSGVTVSYESGLTLNLKGQHAVAGLIKLATDTWVLFGNLEAA